MLFRFESLGRRQVLELEEGLHLLGRSPQASFKISAARISARHAMLRIEGERLYLRDLDSTNGTEVDGRELNAAEGEREVPAGKTFKVAGIDIDWTLPEEPTWAASLGTRIREETLPDGESGPYTHLTYNLDEGYGKSARLRIADVLSELIELIATEDGPEQIATRACEFVSHCISADTVSLLEDSGEGTALHPLGFWTTRGTSRDESPPSRAVIQKVIEERTTLLQGDLGSESPLTSDSIVDMHIRSVIAVPLFDNERVRGILYAHSQHKPAKYSEDDLQLITATANAIAVKLRNLTMERELSTAARIQKTLLPRSIPAIVGYDLKASLTMCRAVGGDLYHVIPRGSGRVLLALGDVAGKGMPAALAMSGCMVLLSTLADGDESLCDIMSRTHKQLYKVLSAEQFVTLFLAELDPISGELAYVNAGHEPPLLISAEGELVRLDSSAPPVAMLPQFGCEVSKVTIEPGALLAVFSDGIPEATLDGRDFLGVERVEEMLTEARAEPLPSLAAALQDEVHVFLKGGHASDDISLLLLRRDP